MKSSEFLKEYQVDNKPVAESASAGATGASSVATAVGGAAGFGQSIFMKRNPAKPKKSKK
jgi:hypothetical protein